MNPKPFSALNHLTVPCAMVLSLRGESDTDPRTVRRSGLVDDFDTFGCKHPWSQARGDILQSRGTDSRTVTGYSLSRFDRKDQQDPRNVGCRRPVRPSATGAPF